MTEDRIRDAHNRREMRRTLRWVSRLLRGFSLLLIALGGAGLLLGSSTDWWEGPSWFSLIVGVVLFLVSIVQRVQHRRHLAGMPGA